jgi:hypothetical protein
MSRRVRRQRVVAILAALLPCLLLQLWSPFAASAAAPSSQGWWTQNPLSPLGPTVPPEGLFVENVPSGPSALSALRLDLPSGTGAGTLTLDISGPPVITQAPVACLATSPFLPAQGGAWANRPSYDCGNSVTGVVNSDSTQVQFLVGGLVVMETLSVVVLAGGATDRIAFDKPGADSVSLTASATAAPQPTPTTARPSQAPTPVVGPVLPSAAPPVTLAPAPSPASARPAPIAPSPTVIPQATGRAAAPDLGDGPAEWRRGAGTLLGVALLLLSILYWSDGFGAVPLRSSLAARDVRRAHA